MYIFKSTKPVLSGLLFLDLIAILFGVIIFSKPVLYQYSGMYFQTTQQIGHTRVFVPVALADFGVNLKGVTSCASGGDRMKVGERRVHVWLA